MTIILIIAGIVMGAGCLYGLKETYFLQVFRHDLSGSRTRGITMVQLSDLHGRVRYLNGRLSRRVNALHPDCVIITGDLATRKNQLPRVYAELAKIDCPHIYFVPGNYERQTVDGLRKRNYSEGESLVIMEALRAIGIRVLVNSEALLQIEDTRILLYGVDNSVYGQECLNENVAWDGHDYVVLLAHCPSVVRIIDDAGLSCDLLLTGHTHGGQVRLFQRSFGAYKDYHVGLKSLGERGHFYIHRGSGTVKLPLRLGCPPEIAVFQL